MKLRLFIPLALFGMIVPASAAIYQYNGDLQPQQGVYGTWFTTIGGGSYSPYFSGTTWSSDGDVLTINTIYPNYGVWFGRTSNVGGDPAGFSMGGSLDGNRVDATIALGASSTEWSLYWYDTAGYAASFYFLSTGFQIAYNDTTATIAVPDMTAFHTYAAHIHNGQVIYYFDGNPIATGTANTPDGTSNFLLIGDSSASTPSGTGSMLIDSMTINTAAGAIPEPSAGALLLGALALGAFSRRR